MQNNEEISFFYYSFSMTFSFFTTYKFFSGAGRVLRGSDCLLQRHSRLHRDRRGKYTPRGASHSVLAKMTDRS